MLITQNRIRLSAYILGALFSIPALAADMSGWSDKTVCRLVEQQGKQEYVDEAKARGLGCVGNAITNYSDSNTANSIYSPQSGSNYTHTKKYYEAPPFFFSLAKILESSKELHLATINAKGEKFPLNKIKGIDEISNLYEKHQVSQYPNKKNWVVEFYWDSVKIKEESGWAHSEADMVSEFVSVDLNKDGKKDWLAFLYGFTQLRFDKSSNQFIGCPKSCTKGDLVLPVVAFITNDDGSLVGPVDAGLYFQSGKAPYVKNARMIRIGDFNSDGIDDFVIADGGWDNPPHGYRPSYKSHLFLSSGDKFKHEKFGIKDKAHGIATGDIDNDGDLDFIISYVSKSHVYKNDGKGNFKKQGNFSVGYMTSFHEFIDVNEDGYLDILYGTSGCGNSKSGVLLNNKRGYFSTSRKIHLPIETSSSCAWRKGSEEDWQNDAFDMIHHLVEFDDKILLITSNNHFGWGYSTLLKKEGKLRLIQSGKFIEGINPNHFPYKLSLNGNKVTLFDFHFTPYEFRFNQESGVLEKI